MHDDARRGDEAGNTEVTLVPVEILIEEEFFGKAIDGRRKRMDCDLPERIRVTKAAHPR